MWRALLFASWSKAQTWYICSALIPSVRNVALISFISSDLNKLKAVISREREFSTYVRRYGISHDTFTLRHIDHSEWLMRCVPITCQQAVTSFSCEVSRAFIEFLSPGKEVFTVYFHTSSEKAAHASFGNYVVWDCVSIQPPKITSIWDYNFPK